LKKGGINLNLFGKADSAELAEVNIPKMDIIHIFKMDEIVELRLAKKNKMTKNK